MRALIAPFHHYLALLLVAGFVDMSNAGTLEYDSTPQLLTESEVQYFSSETKHPGFNEWHSVTGPVLWNPELYSRYDGARIRYTLPGVDQLGSQAGFYLWRYSMNARIYLNATLVAGGDSLNPIARNLHRPLLARLDSSLLRKDTNEVVVELRVVPGYGYLLPPALGDYELLLPEYRSRYFNQITLSWIILGITLLIALLGFCLWMFDRDNTSYLYFSIAALSWTVYSINPVIQDMAVSIRVWQWLLHTGIDVFCVMFVFFNHRYFNLQRRSIETASLVYLVCASFAYALLPMESFAINSTLVHLGAFAIWLYCIGTMLWLAWWVSRKDALVFSLTYAVIFVLGVHDALLNTSVSESLWLSHFFALNLGAPLVLLSVAVQLIWQLRRATVFTEISLQNATVKLEESFKSREKLERESAANEERARIYRDLHDDVGAKLLDIVYLASDEKQAEIAREAIQDIRSIASIPIENAALLSDWVARTRLESMQRTQKYGLNLDWPIITSEQLLSSRQTYHLTHIIRELISNTLKHASAKNLHLSITLGDSLKIELVDDGCGFSNNTRKSGSGMSGIKRRMNELNGSVEWRDRKSGGLRIILIVPLPPAP